MIGPDIAGVIQFVLSCNCVLDSNSAYKGNSPCPPPHGNPLPGGPVPAAAAGDVI